MQDEFVNRLGMFQTALGTLNDPANQPVWSGQPPVIFTTKVAQAATAVTELTVKSALSILSDLHAG